MDTIMRAAMGLLRSATPLPSSLGPSLAASLRRRVLGLVRHGEPPVPTPGWPAAGEGGSSNRPADAPPAAIGDLARALAEELTDDERRLLAWLGERVPPGATAEWVASSHGAPRVRVLRLRERLRDVARRHAAALAPDERVRLERYLAAAPPRVPSPPPTPRPSVASASGRAPGRSRRRDIP